MSAIKLNNDLVNLGHLDSDRPFGLLDRSGRLLESSVGLEVILAARRILAVRDRMLTAIYMAHRRPLEKFLNQAINGETSPGSPATIRLVSSRNPRGMVLRAVPMDPGNIPFEPLRPVALLTVVDLDSPVNFNADDLMQLFDFTRREADVAVIVGQGCTAEATADHLGIGAHTVRQHLKAIYGKVGISRHSELVAILSRLR